MAIEKIKILGALLELPAKQHCRFGQLAPKQLPGFSFFSIVLGAKYSSYVKSIATFAPTFYGHIISVLASVISKAKREETNKYVS